jgi:glycosyltransferase involved in cell wall biosynthesis
VYAGALQPRFRGIETQLEAVARVRARGGDLRFVVLGSSGSDEVFRALARDLGIEAFVQFLPAVEPERLADILRDCDVAVSNSLQYALPSKIFEYIRNGVRLISIDDGNDVNSVCGAFVELYDGTLEALVTGLVSLARTPPDPERIERADRFLAELRAQNDRTIDEAIEEATRSREQPDRPEGSPNLRQSLPERNHVDDHHASSSRMCAEDPAVRGRIHSHVR